MPLRLEDPGQVLAKNEGKRGAHVLVGVRNDAGAFHPGPIVTRDTHGRTHQIVVPFNSAAKIVIFGGLFQLADSNGNAITHQATEIPVAVAPGQQAPSVVINVKGFAAP